MLFGVFRAVLWMCRICCSVIFLRNSQFQIGFEEELIIMQFSSSNDF